MLMTTIFLTILLLIGTNVFWLRKVKKMERAFTQSYNSSHQAWEKQFLMAEQSWQGKYFALNNHWQEQLAQIIEESSDNENAEDTENYQLIH